MMSGPKKKSGKILLLLLAIVAAIGIFVSNTDSYKYKKAQDLMQDGQYSHAVELFAELDDYGDSETLLQESRYGQAKQLITYQDYEQALWILEDLGDYKDAAQLIPQCHYGKACRLIQDEAYEEAIPALEALGDYEDCPWLILKCHYRIANKAYYANEYQKAYEEFLLAADYEDAAIRADESLYQYGHELFMEERYEEASACFDAMAHQPENAEPHFTTLDDAGEFLAQKQAELADQIVCYVGELPEKCTDDKLWDYLSNYIYFEVSGNSYDSKTKRLRIYPEYYSGDRILYAWRTGDTSILSKSEQKAYTKAKKLVAKAKKESKSVWGRELYLYQWLCNNVKYQSPNMEVSSEEYMKLRQLNCVGALIDGKANCQGYTDAFYLLGTMAGMDIYRFRGKAEGEGHAWNGIMLDDKIYIVDVTFGDEDSISASGKTYTWLNCSHDPDTYKFGGGTEAFPELVGGNVLSKGYHGRKKTVFTTLTDASKYMLKQYKSKGKHTDYVVVKNKKVTGKQLQNMISKYYIKMGVRSYSYTSWIEYYNGNSYIMLKWK